MKKLLISAIVLIIGFLALSFVVLPLIVSQSDVQNYLKEKIREKAGDRFEVAKIGVGFFPSAFIEVKGLNVFLPDVPDRKPLFEARKIRLYLKILPLLFKRFEAKHLALEGASFYWQFPQKVQQKNEAPGFIKITEVTGSVRNLSFNEPSKFKLKGLIYGSKQSPFHVDGSIDMNLEKLKFKVTGASIRFDVQNVTVEHLIQAGVLGQNISLASASLGVKGEVGLVPNSKNLDGNITLTVSKMAFNNPRSAEGNIKVLPLPVSASISSEFFWNQPARVLELRKSSIIAPGIDGDAYGNLNLLAEPQVDVSIRLNKINLDQIKKDLAVLLGDKPACDLSGEASCNLILKGTQSQLLVHLDGDFTQTSFAMKNLINKPSGRSLSLSAQSYISGSKTTQGEFGLRFGEMAVKGTVEKFDFSTTSGEINFITNKFPLAEWNGLIPKLQSLKISGSAKVVANIRGNFSQPGALNYSSHMTLDQAVIHQDGKILIQGLSGDFDLEPDKFAIQTSNLVFGGSDLGLALELRDFNAPFFQGRLTSSNLVIDDLNALVERIRQFKLESAPAAATATPGPVQTVSVISLKEAYAAPSLPQAPQQTLIPLELYRAKGNMDINLSNVSWQGRTFQKLSGRLDWNYGDLLIPQLRAAMGEGGILAQGSVTWKTNPASFTAHVESEGVPVEGLTLKKFIRGALDSSSDFQGYLGNSEIVQNSLAGQGVFQVQNGEIQGISLLGSLSSLPSLVGLGKLGKIGGSTEFGSLDGNFQIAERSVQFPSLKLQSRTTNVTAQGTIGFDKSIYFKGVIELTAGVGGLLQKTVDEGTPVRVPLEVGGTIEHPKVNIAQAALGSTLVQDALGSILKKKKSSGSSSGSTASTASQILQSFLS